MSRSEHAISRLESSESEADLDIALLGPLAVSRSGSRLDVTGPKRRALLILLALHAGAPVGPEAIVEALWPNERTGREISTLRVHISHLRDTLEPDRDAESQIIVTRGSGYMLVTEHVGLDIVRFERLVVDGRSYLAEQPELALERLDAALRLWRGRPLQDVEYEEFAQESIRRLESARLQTLEDRAEALIALGQDTAAIEDLEAMVHTHPTRENPVLLLMRALYRTGRQAEALRVARRHTRHLAQQGLEPSPRLSVLEDQILTHDPVLLPAESTPSGDIRPGRSVRGYELREEVGAGSIGVVYRAFQPSVGREVAVKVIHPRFAQAPEFVRRFAEEARLVASLEHPHIVPLHDFWREPGGAFLVLRWMDGGSLDHRIGRSMDRNAIGAMFGQLCSALGYAHSAGVVHRDIRPENVLFDGAGNAYLSDFGLAVIGIETGHTGQHPSPIEPPYAPPEVVRGEGPTVAADIYGLGVLLAEVTARQELGADDPALSGGLGEVVTVATAPNPADRYPDTAAFRAALDQAIGPAKVPAPRRVRRNPYKGLEPFEEGDSADFYGRDDVIERLLDVLMTGGLTAIIGASGSGKSSLVKAGVIPQLRQGAVPGSDEWAIVSMVPGADPFDEFHIGLRSAALVHGASLAGQGSGELRAALLAALDGPSSRALLFVDQFEEVFSTEVDQATRLRFVDNLVDLATDPAHHVRVILTLRADFSDRPLDHPRLGELMARGSVLLAPMLPEQIEDAIRRPAARVGVEVEPGLVSEIVRDVSSAAAYLPLLQYVLAELFERRSEDRLTVHAYRSLGGLHGVLERRAEATYASLDRAAQIATRQLFLRMVHVGDHGEETRRRLPVSELRGLGKSGDIDTALEAFDAVRLITYDRDPVTRAPTVEVAHETVIRHWTRYRIWVDEARADLMAHRRLAASAAIWSQAAEDPSYLLTGGPLAAAQALVSGDRLSLNELEERFLAESEQADQKARRLEVERRLEESRLRHRARRRLMLGIGTAVVAVIVGAIAVFAWMERQRANDLAATQAGQSLARELAAASLGNLTSADPDLSLLLAIAGAEQSLEAGEEILPEVVEALHRAVINPRPHMVIEGAGSARSGQILDYSADGSMLLMLSRDGGASVVDADSGETLYSIPAIEPPAFGVDFHPDGRSILTIHRDGARQWDLESGRVTHRFPRGGVDEVTAAQYSGDGSRVGVGGDDGVIRVFDSTSLDVVAVFDAGHTERVSSIEFSPDGTRVASAGFDGVAIVWELESQTELVRTLDERIVTEITSVSWHPWESAAAVTVGGGEMFLFDADTGERLNSYGTGQNHSHAISFDPNSGALVIAAGADGFARLYGSWTGGEAAIELPSGGVPLRDAEFRPGRLVEIATVGVDGRVRIWRDILGSELPERNTGTLYGITGADAGGDRFFVNAHAFWLGTPPELQTTIEVIDASTGQTLLTRPTIRGWDELQRDATISRDGSLVAYSGPSGDLEIADVDTGQVTVLEDSGGWAASLSFSSDGQYIAGGGYDGTIAVWEVATGELSTTLTGHGDRRPAYGSAPSRPTPGLAGSNAQTALRVDDLEFHPDGRLASSGLDGTVRIWDPSTGAAEVIHEFDYETSSIALSPDGDTLAASDIAGNIVLLDGSTGEIVDRLESVSGGSRLAFSPDGTHIAGAGPGRLAYVWDLDTGRIARRFAGAFYPATSVGFVDDGTELLVMEGTGIVRRYVLDPERLLDLARDETARELTDEECMRYLRRVCDRG